LEKRPLMISKRVFVFSVWRGVPGKGIFANPQRGGGGKAIREKKKDTSAEKT